MADHNIFDDWYKHKLDGLRFSPSDEVWENVEDTLDTDQVWNKLEDSLDLDQVWANVETSLDIDVVWNRVDETLDLDQVWTRIEATLDEEKPPRALYWWWRGGAAAAILLIGVVGYFLLPRNGVGPQTFADSGLPTVTEMRPFYGIENPLAPKSVDANPEDGKTDGVVENGDNPSSNFPGVSPRLKEKLIKGRNRIQDENRLIFIVNQGNNPATSNQQKDDLLNPGNPSISMPSDKDDALRRQRILDYVQGQRVALADLNPPPGLYIPDPADAVVPEEDLKKKISPQFTVGGTMGVKNQWLMAHDTYASFKKTENQSAQVDFAGTMGVNAGLQLTRKLGIQTDYILRSTAGQKYTDYTGGKSVDRELDFNYQSLLLTARLNRKEGSLFNKPLVDHFNVGMYGGLLTQAQEQVSGKTVSDIASEYKTYDLGLSVGYGVDIKPTKDVIAGFGLRLQQGLVNTYEGTRYLPSSLNRTYNTSIDFIFNLRYNLHKK